MIEDNAGTLRAGPRLHERVARQFSRPEGRGGLAIAALMRLINWLPNRHAIRLLEVGPGDDVLEIGFGPGHALGALTRLTPCGTVTGVDRSRTMFHAATARNAAAISAGRMTLRRGSFEALPLPDASVDRILAVNVLYFVGPLRAAFAEARRVLRPGGSLALYVTDRGAMRWLQFEGADTRHGFEHDSLLRVLRDSAFRDDRIVIRRVWLPFGFRGLLARVTRAG